MPVEVVERGTGSQRHPAPLLFVHGAFHGAWCWTENFLNFFADNGYRALALNLRGHGNSPSDKPLNHCTVADYVDDIHEVASGLPVPPVVIGHSMGGFIVQKYLAVHAAPAGVLVASAPPRGLLPAMVRASVRHPRHIGRPALVRRPLLFFGQPVVARSSFYSRATPVELVNRYNALLQDESTRVLYRDLLYADLANPDRVGAPVLVLGADEDGLISRRQVRATARAYRTRARMFPGMGHNMMLEPGWRDVARCVDAWLTGLDL